MNMKNHPSAKTIVKQILDNTQSKDQFRSYIKQLNIKLITELYTIEISTFEKLIDMATTFDDWKSIIDLKFYLVFKYIRTVGFKYPEKLKSLRLDIKKESIKNDYKKGLALNKYLIWQLSYYSEDTQKENQGDIDAVAEALKIYEENKIDKDVHYYTILYSAITVLWFFKNKDSKYLEYLEECREFYEKIDARNNIIRTNYILALMYTYLNLPNDETIRRIKQILKRKDLEKTSRIIGFHSLAHLKIIQLNFNEVEFYCTKLIEETEDITENIFASIYSRLYGLLYLSQVYLMKTDFSKTLKTLKEIQKTLNDKQVSNFLPKGFKKRYIYIAQLILFNINDLMDKNISHVSKELFRENLETILQVTGHTWITERISIKILTNYLSQNYEENEIKNKEIENREKFQDKSTERNETKTDSNGWLSDDKLHLLKKLLNDLALSPSENKLIRVREEILLLNKKKINNNDPSLHININQMLIYVIKTYLSLGLFDEFKVLLELISDIENTNKDLHQDFWLWLRTFRLIEDYLENTKNSEKIVNKLEKVMNEAEELELFKIKNEIDIYKQLIMQRSVREEFSDVFEQERFLIHYSKLVEQKTKDYLQKQKNRTKALHS